MLDRIHETAYALLIILTVEHPTMSRPINKLRELINRLHGEAEPVSPDAWPVVKPWTQRTAAEIESWEWQLAIARIADRMDRWHTRTSAGAKLPGAHRFNPRHRTA
jgi:hypothetical protein